MAGPRGIGYPRVNTVAAVVEVAAVDAVLPHGYCGFDRP